MTAPESGWTCVDCDFSSQDASPFPPWRRTFGLVVLVLGVVTVAPLPLFLWRARTCFALAVRQPVTIVLLCCALLASLFVPYREFVGEENVPCACSTAAWYATFAFLAPSEVLRALCTYQLYRRQARLLHTSDGDDTGGVGASAALMSADPAAARRGSSSPPGAADGRAAEPSSCGVAPGAPIAPCRAPRPAPGASARVHPFPPASLQSAHAAACDAATTTTAATLRIAVPRRRTSYGESDDDSTLPPSGVGPTPTPWRRIVRMDAVGTPMAGERPTPPHAEVGDDDGGSGTSSGVDDPRASPPPAACFIASVATIRAWVHAADASLVAAVDRLPPLSSPALQARVACVAVAAIGAILTARLVATGARGHLGVAACRLDVVDLSFACGAMVVLSTVFVWCTARVARVRDSLRLRDQMLVASALTAPFTLWTFAGKADSAANAAYPSSDYGIVACMLVDVGVMLWAPLVASYVLPGWRPAGTVGVDDAANAQAWGAGGGAPSPSAGGGTSSGAGDGAADSGRAAVTSPALSGEGSGTTGALLWRLPGGGALTPRVARGAVTPRLRGSTPKLRVAGGAGGPTRRVGGGGATSPFPGSFDSAAGGGSSSYGGSSVFGGLWSRRDSLVPRDGGAVAAARARVGDAAALLSVPSTALTGEDFNRLTLLLVFTHAGRRVFKPALTAEFALENMLFLLDAARYADAARVEAEAADSGGGGATAPSVDGEGEHCAVRAARALVRVANAYFRQGAPMQVNVSAAAAVRVVAAADAAGAWLAGAGAPVAPLVSLASAALEQQCAGEVVLPPRDVSRPCGRPPPLDACLLATAQEQVLRLLAAGPVRRFTTCRAFAPFRDATLGELTGLTPAHASAAVPTPVRPQAGAAAS